MYRVALVSCVKLKMASAAPARDLYVSSLFRGMRAFAEANADTWYILSAQHGVLRPDQVTAPYERTLNKMRKPERTAWALRVQKTLCEILPAQAEVILLAGMRYREDVEPFLRDRGYSVTVPMDGLGFGNQLKWLKQDAERRSVR